MIFALVYSLLVVCTIGVLIDLNRRLLRSQISKASERFYEHKTNLMQWQRVYPSHTVALSSEGNALACIAVMYCKEVITIIGDEEHPKFKRELESLYRLLDLNPNPPDPGIHTTSARKKPCAL